MMDENEFAHDKSQYERPNFPYRCGRGVLWQKPCYQGPNLDGSCGGVSECTPALKGSRWQCKRSKSAGGACEDGPTPYGECGLKRTPCAPKPTLRVYRGRLALLVAILIVALIGFLQAFYPINNRFFKSSDLNPISKAHQKFAQESGCTTCHASHNKGPGALVKALVTKTDLSANCVNCHTFAGPSSKAHNGGIKKDHDYQDTHCQMCHLEHKGESFNTKVLTGKQCNFCHKTKFESFSRGHPEFREKFPYLKRNSIKFNHVSHFNKHFEKSKNKGPKTCTGCHNITSADRAVRSFGFDVVCAECHARQIISKNLNLITLPEMPLPESEEDLIDRNEVFSFCAGPVMIEMDANMDELKKRMSGPERKKMEAERRKMEAERKNTEMEEFEAVSTDSVTVISAYLLNLKDKDSSEEYATPIQELILEMAGNGTDRMAQLIEEHSANGMAKKLLAGLHPEVLKRAACAWALNEEYEPPIQSEYGGWFANLVSVGYTPFGHADPVAKSWIEFALAATAGEEDQQKRELAKAMQKELVDPKDGVGSCIKCHAVTAKKSAKGKEQLFVEWEITWPELKPFVFYSHKNHIDMLGVDDSCQHCHVMDDKAKYKDSFETEDPAEFVSNFRSIERNQCVTCHSENQVAQECQLCHIYHLKPGFKKTMMTVAKTQPSINN
ncbi:MAG: hypothetical protein IID17_01955 [Nitrospinae bacterium]|nr:hypothetical protein [Nitrospinota bacterium]